MTEISPSIWQQNENEDFIPNFFQFIPNKNNSK